MKYVLLIACGLALGFASSTKPQVEQEFLKGVTLVSLANWIMNSIYGADDKSTDYKFKRDSLSVILKAMIDPVFEHELLNKSLSVTDPRRYVIMALFQSGKLVPKALDFVSSITARLNDWWKKASQPEHIPIFREDDVSTWTEKEEECPAEDSYWDKIKNAFYTIASPLASIAVACLVNYVVYKIVYELGRKAANVPQNQWVDLGIKLAAQESGVGGSTYLTDWFKTVVGDIFSIENSPQFSGTPLHSL